MNILLYHLKNTFMKKNNFLMLVFLLPLTILMGAFIVPFGGEGYEIYIDNKLVLQQFGQQMKQVKSLQLNASQAKSELNVKFYHCGMAGKSRTLELRTPEKQVLKQWQFANEEAKNFAITVPVKEILDLQKKAGAGTLHLYYSSKEAPDGRFLAGIVMSEKSLVVK
jgi:hypothetical protein